MKQLLILSGKGGTGKTTIAGAFIKLSNARAFADCDVDAPNLHLISENSQTEPSRTDYYGLPKAKIDPKRCIECDLCRQNCRFDAIFVKRIPVPASKDQASVPFSEDQVSVPSSKDQIPVLAVTSASQAPGPAPAPVNQVYEVDLFACEGCGVCELVCPADAVTLNPAVAGEMMLYTNKDRFFSTAQLKMGSGTSGMLVSEVKKQMKLAADNVDFAIIDGSPGIGCPVIASLSGVDMVLIVAEPSLSGISDMERIIKTAAKFGVKTVICINKFDTNLENTKKIERFCQDHGLPFVGRIPFDKEAVKAINSGKTIVDIECAAGSAVREVYQQVMDRLLEDTEAAS